MQMHFTSAVNMASGNSNLAGHSNLALLDATEPTSRAISAAFYGIIADPMIEKEKKLTREANKYVRSTAVPEETLVPFYSSNLDPKLPMHQCHKCPYSSIQKGDIQKHVLIHMDVKPFECDVCHYKSNFKSAVLRHVKKKHLSHMSS